MVRLKFSSATKGVPPAQDTSILTSDVCASRRRAGGTPAPSEELQRFHSVSILSVRSASTSAASSSSYAFSSPDAASAQRLSLPGAPTRMTPTASPLVKIYFLTNALSPFALFNVFLFQFASLALRSIDFCVCLLPTAHFFLATPIPT